MPVREQHEHLAAWFDFIVIDVLTLPNLLGLVTSHIHMKLDSFKEMAKCLTPSSSMSSIGYITIISCGIIVISVNTVRAMQ